MNGILVSVIVTVHNAEKYIERCIRSVMNQSFKDIEILCVDGGSRDTTPSILRSLRAEDDRIKIIDDPNTSYGHKINVGIDMSQGRYITILESDDTYFENMLEELFKVAESAGCDFVDGDLYRMFEYKGIEYGSHDDKYTEKKHYNKLIENNWEDEDIFCPGAIYTALYRRDFLLENSIRMHESAGASYQDVGFAFLTHALAKKTYHLNMPVYKYRQDNESSSIYNCKKIHEIADEFVFIKEEFEKRDIKNELIWHKYYLLKYGCYQDRLNFMTPEGRYVFLNRIIPELEADIEAGNISIVELNNSYGTLVYSDDMDKERINTNLEVRDKTILPERVCHMFDIIGGKNAVVCCAGIRGQEAIFYAKQNADINVVGICDNSESKWGNMIEDIMIKRVADNVSAYPNAEYLITNVKAYEGVRNQLLELGVAEGNIHMY